MYVKKSLPVYILWDTATIVSDIKCQYKKRIYFIIQYSHLTMVVLLKVRNILIYIVSNKQDSYLLFMSVFYSIELLPQPSLNLQGV